MIYKICVMSVLVVGLIASGIAYGGCNRSAAAKSRTASRVRQPSQFFKRPQAPTQTVPDQTSSQIDDETRIPDGWVPVRARQVSIRDQSTSVLKQRPGLVRPGL
jgi:hypothetical protein